MRKFLIILIVCLQTVSCHTTKQTVKNNRNEVSRTISARQIVIDNKTTLVEEVSDDKTYGYAENNPIKVGGGMNGPLNERFFMDALAGPNGETVSYYRLGSCCTFKTPNGVFGNQGFLDKYEVKYEGLDKPIILYFNMYDPGGLIKIPMGFTSKINF